MIVGIGAGNSFSGFTFPECIGITRDGTSQGCRIRAVGDLEEVADTSGRPGLTAAIALADRLWGQHGQRHAHHQHDDEAFPLASEAGFAPATMTQDLVLGARHLRSLPPQRCRRVDLRGAARG